MGLAQTRYKVEINFISKKSHWNITLGWKHNAPTLATYLTNSTQSEDQLD